MPRQSQPARRPRFLGRRRFQRGHFLLAALLLTAPLAVGAPVLGAASPAGAAANHDPIKIGVVCSCLTALASSNGIAIPGIQAWAASVNAHGGINGHKVQLMVENDSASAEQSVPEVQKLVNEDHIVALMQDSDVDESWTSYIESAHVPVIGLGSEATQDYTSSDFFSPGQTEDSGGISEIDGVKRAGAHKLALMYCVEAAVCSETVPSIEKLGKEQGVPVTYVEGISASSPNFVAQCLAAKASGADAMAIGDGASVIEAVTRDCAQQGYTPVMIEGDGALALSFTVTPGLKENTISPQPNIPFTAQTAGVKAMEAAFQKYQPHLLKDPNYNELALQAWVSGLLFQAAAKAGHLGVNGAPTSKELYNGLYSLHGVTLGGMAPPLSYKKGQPNPIHCWYWMSIKNGRFATPYGLKPTCA
jgi:branched-chain amino acid transport system substrate-binding protein